MLSAGSAGNQRPQLGKTRRRKQLSHNATDWARGGGEQQARRGTGGSLEPSPLCIALRGPCKPPLQLFVQYALDALKREVTADSFAVLGSARTDAIARASLGSMSSSIETPLEISRSLASATPNSFQASLMRSPCDSKKSHPSNSALLLSLGTGCTSSRARSKDDKEA